MSLALTSEIKVLKSDFSRCSLQFAVIFERLVKLSKYKTLIRQKVFHFLQFYIFQMFTIWVNFKVLSSYFKHLSTKIYRFIEIDANCCFALQFVIKIKFSLTKVLGTCRYWSNFERNNDLLQYVRATFHFIDLQIFYTLKMFYKHPFCWLLYLKAIHDKAFSRTVSLYFSSVCICS